MQQLQALLPHQPASLSGLVWVTAAGISPMGNHPLGFRAPTVCRMLAHLAVEAGSSLHACQSHLIMAIATE